MTSELAVPTWLVAVIALALVGLLLLLARTASALAASRRQTEELLAAAARDADALRAELAGLEDRLAQIPAPLPVPVAVVDDREYLITDLGEDVGPRLPARIVPAPLFADIVVRESVIRTAALAAGLRRALSPEVRNRIRFEMRREVKRSRKARRTALKAARRDWEDRQRAGIEAAS